MSTMIRPKIVALVQKGFSIAQIIEELNGISRETVQNYIDTAVRRGELAAVPARKIRAARRAGPVIEETDADTHEDAPVASATRQDPVAAAAARVKADKEDLARLRKQEAGWKAALSAARDEAQQAQEQAHTARDARQSALAELQAMALDLRQLRQNQTSLEALIQVILVAWGTGQFGVDDIAVRLGLTAEWVRRTIDGLGIVKAEIEQRRLAA